jgi:hypothetical protein
MATYARITPALLASYGAVINDPTDQEDANKLAQVDLQSRRFVYDFLIRFFDETASDTLKAAAIVDASVAGKVKGSTSNGGTQQGIVQGTVSTPDLRDDAVATAKILALAVTSAKLADDSVTNTKIASAAVNTDELANNSVITDKLANDAVDAAKLKDDATGLAGAVTTDHIRTDAVTQAKIADTAVGPDQLFLAVAEANILVADASKKFQSVALSGDVTITAAGILTITARQFAHFVEKAGNGVGGGSSIAGGAGFSNLNIRGVSTLWNPAVPVGGVTPGVGGRLTFGQTGTYSIEGFVPGFETGKHIARLARYNSADLFQNEILGSSEVAAIGGVPTCSRIIGEIIIVTVGDYIKIEHWTEFVKATTGLGSPTSSGATGEVYAQLYIRRLR